MVCVAREKIKKGLWLRPWVIDILDSEAGPLDNSISLTASAAILMFSEALPAAKAAYVRKIQEQDLAQSYNLDTAALSDPTIVVDGVTIRTDSKSEGYQRGRAIARKGLAKGRAKKAAKKAANEQK